MRTLKVIFSFLLVLNTAFAEEEITNQITRINLVVNSLDREHLDRTLQELLKITSERKIKIGAVFQIGDLKNISINMQSQIRARGGEILSVTKPPSVYPVTTSPAWILISNQGSNIVEGSNNIERFISAQGAFLTPEDPEFAEKIPTAQTSETGFNVEGF